LIQIKSRLAAAAHVLADILLPKLILVQVLIIYAVIKALRIRFCSVGGW